MNRLELRLPPVVVVVLAALAMWWFAGDARAPATTLRTVLALAPLALGFALALAGVREFRRARTTVNPLQPAQAVEMVTSGVYRYTRNPMYLGMLCVLAAWAAWLGRPAPWLVLPVFALYMTRFQIVPEERALERLFGARFTTYAARVRRWL